MQSDLVALEFRNRAAFQFGLALLDERRNMPFHLLGNRNIVIARKHLRWFQGRLRESGRAVKLIPVISASDLPQGELDRIRADAKRSRHPKSAAWKKRRIAALKKRLDE